MSYIDIPASESGLPFALDQYYEELNRIVGERGGQPLLLNNTITTFDIVPEAPFYTEGVFRHFADRKFRVSPEDLGTAIQADRFSHEYERVIEIASTKIDTQVPSEIRQQIENNKREIRRVNKDLIQFEKEVNSGWEEIVKNENLKPETTGYSLRHINYLESILYADEKQEFTNEIQDYRRAINNLRSSTYTQAQQKLIRSLSELAETYKIARPWNIYVERDIPDATVFTFAEPKYRSVQFCDVSPSIYPSANLVLFQQRPDESRKITVTQNTTHNQLHTKTWGVGGSGKFKVFGIRIGGGGGGSGSSSYKKNFKKLSSFEINFAGISEIYANRGLWFDPSLFNNDELKPLFDDIPGARDLEYVAVSLIIGRGLTLKLNFDETLETEEWSKKTFKGRGGVSILGYSFGGSGNSSTYDYDYTLSTNKKEVTFTDDPKHCRLLGVRLERIYHPKVAEGYNLMSENAAEAFNKGLAEGKMSLLTYQSLKLMGFPHDEVKTAIESGSNALSDRE